ncbi:hypothetical protein [Actinacidiphila sp. ITFR-21]|uniref:hypothetical protein n=1 Tax=Actinacidiphila sp. ITFR-21 TaxID=3075199 RepID=UPI00288C1EFF|nr:hypothetical protein [Streptomyces sp. ITFR-21]WNI17636.1 hypothetical protein RLT57_20315 [Streptomyces sp. ITFR-21]WNI17776.1 hypothetical protein RLT57_21030 [Streptomyces sp. ITFR-21]
MTNPGQSTPWGKIPIPTEGKTPDIPVDLAAVADPIDTLLKNVIGGATAPTGPLSPSLIEASASIGSLNSTQSSQQSAITTMQGQITALSAAPWAVATSRTALFSLAGNVKTPTLVHSYQVPTFTERRLLIAHSTISVGWTDTTAAAVRARIQLRADGATTYVDRNQFIANGTDQTMHLHFIETVEAGKSVRVGISLDIYGAAASSKAIQTQELSPRMYLMALPWTGPTVPQLALI